MSSQFSKPSFDAFTDISTADERGVGGFTRPGTLPLDNSRHQKDSAEMKFCSLVIGVPQRLNMDRIASLKLRQIRDVPSSAQSLDQQHTRLEPPSPDIDVVSFVGELNRLRGNHPR